jgi:hypothetical protein
MIPIKNFIEYALIMEMTKIFICQQDDLEHSSLKRAFDDENPCHIYLITLRPRVIIVPEKCEFNKFNLKLVFKVQNKFEYEEKELFLKSNEDTTGFKLVSEFPYTKFYFYKNNEQILYAKSSLYYFRHQIEYNEQMNSELLYIGQSFGKNGNRQSPDRLKSHSTLQNIYSQAIQNNPDKEIWINLLSFKSKLFTSFNGKDKTLKHESNEVEKVSNIMHKFLNNKLDEKQIINFTEASLIKYFKPKYNIIYKDKFPNPLHTTYKECYDLDINSVAFELDTESIGTKLFTDNIPPDFSNLGSFTIESRDKRKSLFDVLDNDLLPSSFGNIRVK